MLPTTNVSSSYGTYDPQTSRPSIWHNQRNFVDVTNDELDAVFKDSNDDLCFVNKTNAFSS